MGKGKFKYQGSILNPDKAKMIGKNTMQVPIINVLSYSGKEPPKNRIGFDILKDGILKKADGNRLTIEKDGKERTLYIHECSDALYMTQMPKKNNEETCGKGGVGTALKPLVGKRITQIKKRYNSHEDVEKNLPICVDIYGEGLESYLFITGNDGGIDVYERPTAKTMFGTVYKITQKPMSEWTRADVEKLAELQRDFSIPLFDEEKLQIAYEKLSPEKRNELFPPEKLEDGPENT